MSDARPAALWSYGFRPFFLLAAGWAVVAMLLMLGGLAAGLWPADAPAIGRWHGHELLFGFVAAAVAGFLLTAVPTWTGTAPVTGRPLAGLALLWLAGRAVSLPWLSLQGTAWALVDVLFFPVVAAAIGAKLLATGNTRNYQFVLLLAVLAGADGAFHAAQAGWLSLPFDPLRLAVNVITLMIGVIGGRVVPLFTRNALVKAGQPGDITPLPWLDRAHIALLVAVLAVDAVRPDTALAGWTALGAAVLHAARLARWRGLRTLGMPIVWVLHAGYGWIAIGLALKAAWLLLGALWAFNWLHGLTAGAFGTMVLAMMTRVALGHSGRPLEVSKPIAAAYVLAIGGALVRIFGPAFVPQATVSMLTAALLLWTSAFGLFLAVYVPILVAPRIKTPA